MDSTGFSLPLKNVHNPGSWKSHTWTSSLMENRESLDEVQNHVDNRLPPEQGCSTSADAPNSAQRKQKN